MEKALASGAQEARAVLLQTRGQIAFDPQQIAVEDLEKTSFCPENRMFCDIADHFLDRARGFA